MHGEEGRRRRATQEGVGGLLKGQLQLKNIAEGWLQMAGASSHRELRTVGLTVTTRWRQAPRRPAAQPLFPNFPQRMEPQRGQSQNLPDPQQQRKRVPRGRSLVSLQILRGSYPFCFSVPEILPVETVCLPLAAKPLREGGGDGCVTKKMEENGPWTQETRAQVPSLTLTGCVTWELRGSHSQCAVMF